MDFPDVNLLKYLLTFMTFFIVIVGSLVNWFESRVPVFLPQTFRYGKFAYEGKPSSLKLIEVPKSWFKHFYVFSSLSSLYALYLVVDVYLYGAKPSNEFIKYLDFLCGSSRTTESSSVSVLVAMSLIAFQSFKRFYESWFVSVYSKGKINISQYLVGFIHYWATITIVLAGASGFKSSGTDINRSNLSFLQICGVILFIGSWIYQYKAVTILANLRKNATGVVVTKEHKIPRGGLFEYISSPHLVCEVLIYLSLWMILYDNENFKYVFLWVLSNQLETSLLNHWWYQKTFKNYPTQRKAFIPFIY